MSGTTALGAWSPNSEPDLAGYRMYFGLDPLVMTGFVDVGLTATPATPEATIGNFPSAGFYYFNVTAYNASNLESLHSNLGEKWIDAALPVDDLYGMVLM